MANYPRTENQIMKRIRKSTAKNIARNAKKMNLMNRCMSEAEPRTPMMDVSGGETPDSVPEREVDLDRKEEMDNFRKELDYANRLNRVEDYTGLRISGDEDVKREVLDEGVERILVKAVDVDKRSLEGVYIGSTDETIGDIRKGFGMDVTKGKDEGFDKENSERLSGPRYDANTKQIYLSKGEDSGLSNKLAHEIGHAKIDEWGTLDRRDAGLGEVFDSGIKGEMFNGVSKYYEEVSADILMKERYGDHLAGDTIREQLNDKFGGALKMVANSFDKEEQYHGLGELCSYRAKAEIFGLSDVRATIDSELKSQHGIDVNSYSDFIGKGINDLTNAYCGLQGLDSEKFKGSFNNIMRMSFNLDGGGKWLPPDD